MFIVYSLWRKLCVLCYCAALPCRSDFDNTAYKFTWPYYVLLWLLYLTPDCLMCITDLIVLPAVLIICIRDYVLPLPIYLQLSASRSCVAPNYFPFLPLNIYAWLCCRPCWYIDSIILIITDCTLWYSFDDSILIITVW